MGAATDGRVAFTEKVPENTRGLKAESHEETGIEVIHNRSSLLSPQLFEAYDLGRPASTPRRAGLLPRETLVSAPR
jgi:hypothetical protein